MINRVLSAFFMIAINLLINVSLPLPITAQEAISTPSASPKKNTVFRSAVDKIPKSTPETQQQGNQEDSFDLTPPLNLDKLDEKTQNKYFKSVQSYYDYKSEAYTLRLEAFKDQAWNSKAIFWAVILLVFVGTAFAGVQFLRKPVVDIKKVTIPDSKNGEPQGTETSSSTMPAVAQTKPEQAAPETQIEISLQGIKASSSILGVVILVISFAFFYLYLVYVYPINDTF